MSGRHSAASEWEPRHGWILAAIIAAAVAIRVVVLPAPGFVGDIDQFVTWVGDIGRNGLSNAFDSHLSFGPVMAYVWWLLGFLDPAIVAAPDSSDVGVRIVMKLPAVIAGFVLAFAVAYPLRRHPRWALLGAGVVLLHPAIWFTSAWWGQYDTVYAAAGVLAFLFAIQNRDALAVVALTVALMTKPQAAPLVVPFAAWFLARTGSVDARSLGTALRRLALLAGVGLGTLLVLWLPFLGADGPRSYLDGLARYQGEFYAVLSISAWNVWWPAQELAAHGAFILDGASLIGGISYRVAGYGITALLMVVVAYGVFKRPTPRTLAVGLAAAALVAFSFLTTMHERYAFAALPMLLFLLDDRRIRWLAALFSLTFFLNLLAATGHYIGDFVPFHGPLGIAASLANVACALFLVLELVRGDGQPEAAALINEAAASPSAGTRPGTSAGNAAATSAA
jgi:Gpi18-like mannosyltransferase